MAIIEPVGTMGPRGVRPQRARPKVTLPKPDRIPEMREAFRNRRSDRENYSTLEIPPNYEMPKPQTMPSRIDLPEGTTFENMPQRLNEYYSRPLREGRATNRLGPLGIERLEISLCLRGSPRQVSLTV